MPGQPITRTDLGTRIMILGGPASGKSTLARQLGHKFQLPVYHMDQIHWLPGWVQRPMAERARLATAIELQDNWVFEGSLGATNAHRLSRASSVIWLDLPLPLRLRRAAWRALRYRGQTRPDLPPDCPERFGIETWRFLRYMAATHETYRQQVETLLARRADVPLFRLRRPAEVADFNDRLAPGQASADPA